MEKIEVKGLTLQAFHGVGEQERRVGNLFRLDITLDCDLSRAMESDCVDDTISYADVIDLVKQEMAKPSLLLEHVLWRLRDSLTATWPSIQGGTIRLAKLTPPISCEVEWVAVSTSW